MEFYQENQINELSINKMTDGDLMLTVMPMLESLYSCSGALINEKDDVILISLVRCRMNTECSVDTIAKLDPENLGSYNIIIPNTDKRIEMDYKLESIQVWPQVQ